MIERHFDDELKELNTELLKMAAFTEEAIYKATAAIKTNDAALAQSVIDNDKYVDELEIKIDERALILLALRQPLAADLRFITTGIKINAELERIADLAVNISQRALELVEKPLLKPMVDILELADIAGKMVRNTIDAFVKRDEDLARQVIAMDPEADHLRNLVQKELIEEYLMKDGSTAPRAVPLLLAARHLERICDHATYIAEDVIYMVRAKIVKHKDLRQGD